MEDEEIHLVKKEQIEHDMPEIVPDTPTKQAKAESKLHTLATVPGTLVGDADMDLEFNSIVIDTKYLYYHDAVSMKEVLRRLKIHRETNPRPYNLRGPTNHLFQKDEQMEREMLRAIERKAAEISAESQVNPFVIEDEEHVVIKQEKKRKSDSQKGKEPKRKRSQL
jgi:hypothetical protein